MEDTPPTPPPTTVQKLAAEALGTFVLVLVGCLAFVTSDGSATTVALAFGLTLAAVGMAFGRVTGGHFNPAVTVAAALSGRLAWKDVGVYAGAQVGGGIVAAIVLFALLFGADGYDAFDGSMGQNYFGDESPFSIDYAIWAAPLLELVLTAILVLVFLGLNDERNERNERHERHESRFLAPLAYGLTYAALIFAAFQATGGSMNPARSIGPALFAGGDQLLQVWVFIIGPLLGAAVAGFVYPAVFGAVREPVAGSGLNFSSGSSAHGGQVGQGGQGGYGDPYAQQWNQNQAPQQTGGYQATPAAGGYQAAQAAQAPHAEQQAAPVEQPIIQDGWQWDPQAQQWIPAQQQAPQAPQSGQSGSGWQAPGASGEQTQVRPPD